MTEQAAQAEARTAVAEPSLRLLVIGCGNPMAGDDSVGVEILRRLRAQADGFCQLRELPHANVELLELFDTADVILFLDAVVSGAPPGTLHLVPLPSPSLAPRALGPLSSHGWGLAETLELARALGRRAPHLVLLGVEIARVSLDARRSPPVEEAIGVVVEKFSRLRACLLERGAACWQRPRRFAPTDASFPGESLCV